MTAHRLRIDLHCVFAEFGIWNESRFVTGDGGRSATGPLNAEGFTAFELW